MLSLQLRLAVVAALGPMSHLLPSEKLEEQLPKLLPVVLGLYKKHAETFQISKVFVGREGGHSNTGTPQIRPCGSNPNLKFCVGL